MDAINLDDLIKSEEKIEPTVVGGAMGMEPIPVEEHVSINSEHILEEWSYRCESGYPTYGKQEDMIHLQNILDENNIPLPFERITEAQFFPDDLNKLPKTLLQKLVKAKKQKQFNTFLENLPGGQTPVMMINFLKGLSSSEQDEFVKKLYSVKSVEDIDKADYSTGVTSKLFNLEPKGIGKAELFLAMMVANSKVSGGGESYDLLVNGVKKYEVKDYRTGEQKGIRLGTKGKVNRFIFWQEIMKTVAAVTNLIATNGIQFIKDEELKKLITEIESRASTIEKGEFNKTDIRKFTELYAKLSAMSQSNATGYTYVTFRGPNAEPISFVIDEIPTKLKKSVTVNIKARGASESLMVELRRLKYVRDPRAFAQDMQTAVDQAVGNEIPFIIFRPSGPNITKDFKIAVVSMSTLYIIEADAKTQEK
jgi:hypothetical protein